MAALASPFQEWLLLRAPDGSPATLPGNLSRAFEADDIRLLPVFAAHAWKEHLQSERSRGLREAAEAEQHRQEVAFLARLGLDAERDGDLALELGQVVDRRLMACRRFLHLSAQPMPDGLHWVRLEIRDSEDRAHGSGSEATRGLETLQVIAFDSLCQAEAVSGAIGEVFAARGFQARDIQGLFQLEGPQLATLLAILKQLALPAQEEIPAMAG
jgi:hypothetical protein